MKIDVIHIFGAIITVSVGFFFAGVVALAARNEIILNRKEFKRTFAIVAVLILAGVGFINSAVYLIEAVKNFLK